MTKMHCACVCAIRSINVVSPGTGQSSIQRYVCTRVILGTLCPPLSKFCNCETEYLKGKKLKGKIFFVFFVKRYFHEFWANRRISFLRKAEEVMCF